MKKSQLSQAALSALVASLLMSSAAWAEDAKPAPGAGTEQTAAAVSGQKLRFPDVASSHWALKHITKLALLGVVEGDDRGRYEPEASVTLEQVITMAIRMMGLEDEVAKAKLKESSYVLPFEVSDYAKSYAIVAIEKGLIDPVEETSIVQQGSGKWGSRPATREWVAKLSVRAVGKQNEAKELEGQASAFTDNADLSTWAKGYVNEAVLLKIVDGMEDGSFKPKNNVTRAQMAAFLSRAGQYATAPKAGVTVGVLTSVSADSIKVAGESGDEAAFALTPDTVYYGLGKDTPIQLSDLKENNQVYVIQADGKAGYIEILKEQSEPVLSNTVEGTLVGSDPAAATLTLLTNGQQVVLDLDAGVTFVDKDGKGLAFSSLEAGSKLEVKRTSSKAKFTSVLVKEAPVRKTAEGTVQSLNAAEHQLTVAEKDGQTVQYPLADAVTFTQNGATADLSLIKARDTIRYTVTDGKVTFIELIAAYEEPADTGKLVDIHIERNLSYLIIQRADNKLVTYNLDGSPVPVDIPGMAYAGVTDLLKGDQLKLTLDESKSSVTKISVANRSIKTTYFNTIVNYNASKKLLTVVDGNGQPFVYQLNDNTQVVSDTAALPVSTIGTYLTEGKKVDITANQDTVALKLQLGYGYEGTVLRTDTALNEVTIKLNGQQTLSFKVSQFTRIVLPGVTNPTIASLSEGDRVRINLVSMQDAVGEVLVSKSLSYRVVSVDAARKELKLKNGSGTVSSFILTSEPIVGTADNSINIGDIPVDEPVSVTFSGTTVKQVKLLKAVRGKVTAVDAAAGKLTVLDPQGATQTVQLGASGNIIRSAGGSAAALSDIKADDRVEIYPGANGAYVVQVAQVLTRVVDSYNLIDKKLYFKRPTLNDPVNYDFHAKAYVHKGSDTIQPNLLLPNDPVKIFLIDQKVVELEK